jgi:AcrR family transcriptional regulator
LTKGAFCYHFDTKEAVASAIIEGSFQKLRGAADNVIESFSPALQNINRATFVVARHPRVPDVRTHAGPGTMRKRDSGLELVDERNLLSDLPPFVRRQRR